MLMLHSFIGISAQKAEPMEHPPYPLHKGDLVDVIEILPPFGRLDDKPHIVY